MTETFNTSTDTETSQDLIRQSRIGRNRRQRRCIERHCKLMFLVSFVIGMALTLFISFTIAGNSENTEAHSDSREPRDPQMLRMSSNDSLSLLESLGLKLYLGAFQSTCPSGFCRLCSRNIFKDTKPHIVPRVDCHSGITERVKNASCLLCQFPPGCLSWRAVLQKKYLCASPVNDCEEEKMADLNQYCSTGDAVHDSDNKLQCNCPHGKAGHRCQDEEETKKILCRCYKSEFRLLEEKDGMENCGNIYYSNDSICLDSRQEENCVCYYSSNQDELSNAASCDSGRTKRHVNEGYISGPSIFLNTLQILMATAVICFKKG